MKIKLESIILNVLWILFIIIMMTEPHHDNEKQLFEGIDKIFHAGAFALMTTLLNWLIKTFSDLPNRITYALSILSVIAFGATMEIIQVQYCQRSCEFLDIVADTGGAIIACWLYPVICKTINKLRNS